MCLLNCPPRVANLKFLLTTDHITNSWPFKKMYFLMEAMQAFRSSWGIVVTFFRCGGPVRFINACVKLVQHCVYQKLLKSFDFWPSYMYSKKHALGIVSAGKITIVLKNLKSFLNATQPFHSLLSGTTRVGRYQKKHSPTHTHPDHQTSFINFLYSTASSLFSLHAW